MNMQCGNVFPHSILLHSPVVEKAAHFLLSSAAEKCQPGKLLRCFGLYRPTVGASWPCSNDEILKPCAGELMKLKEGNYINTMVSRQVADVLTNENTKVGSVSLALE